MNYELFMVYLIDELEKATGRGVRFHDEALIECLVKHRELTSGARVWSPVARSHLPFEEDKHGRFCRIAHTNNPCGVKYTGKLLPLYCRLCFLADCHDQAESAARALLTRLEQAARYSLASSLSYETQAVEYMIYNLSARPSREWGGVSRSPDVSADTKVAVDLLWAHLVLVYAGNRKLLLYNIEQFFTRQQNSTSLCPPELRAALFAHGRHDPFSKRNERHRRGGATRWSAPCPVEPRRCFRGNRSRRRAACGRLYETRCARLCWLAALWLFDWECNETVRRWLHKPEPYRH